MINSKYFMCLSSLFDYVEGKIDFYERDIEDYKARIEEEPDNNYYESELKNVIGIHDAYIDILSDLRKVFTSKTSK